MDLVDVLAILTPVVEAFEQIGIPYYVGGSVAATAFGIARSTVDVDMIAVIEPRQIHALVEQLQDTYYIDEQMIRDAIQHRSSFNLIHFATSAKVDVFINKGRPFDRAAMQRLQSDTLDEAEDAREFVLSSPEDLVLAKLEWYKMGGETSERQWNDILGVLKVQGETLDFPYLRQWAAQLTVADLLERAFIDAGLTDDSTN